MWAFLVATAGQWGEPFGFENLAHGRGAEGNLPFLEDLADVVDGVILLAEGDDQIPSSGFFGLRARASARSEEEVALGVVAELVTEDSESSRGVAEAAGGLAGGEVIDKKGAESLVLALLGVSRTEEEVLGLS